MAADPAWRQPEDVRVDEPGMIEGLCVGAVSYDLVEVEHDRAALGYDMRFDVLFPHDADFSADKAAYEALLKSGGRLAPHKPG